MIPKFSKKQKIYDVAGVKIGGQPGELPTVMVGSIFYERHKIVSDERKGRFDRKKAEKLLAKLNHTSELTGSPYILDIVAITAEAFEKYIDFVSEMTTAPFLIDSSIVEARVSATKHVAEVGLLERAIYNSILPTSKEEEIEALRDIGIRRSVLFAYDSLKLLPKDRGDVLKGYNGRKGLLDMAKEAGIEEPIIDTMVLDVPSLAYASKAAFLLKKEFGYPTGCGPANAISLWQDKLKSTMGKLAHKTCTAGASLVAILSCCDFVLYGPVEASEYVFPACAMVDAIIAYSMREHGIRPLTKEHPLYKIF
jgi:tetrahydromethanopterin S-methyltransferase subunit H